MIDPDSPSPFLHACLLNGLVKLLSIHASKTAALLQIKDQRRINPSPRALKLLWVQFQLQNQDRASQARKDASSCNTLAQFTDKITKAQQAPAFYFRPFEGKPPISAKLQDIQTSIATSISHFCMAT